MARMPTLPYQTTIKLTSTWNFQRDGEFRSKIFPLEGYGYFQVRLCGGRADTNHYLRLTLTLAVIPGTSRAWQCLQVVLLMLGSLKINSK